MACLLGGCGKKDQPPAASSEEVRALAAQVEALRKENAALRSPASPQAQPAPAVAGEPTEGEMRQAIQDRIDMINENIERMRNTRPNEDNPIESLMALGGAVLGDTQYAIRAFRKLGYMCDYLLQFRVTGKSGAPVDSIMKLGGSLCTARFVKDGDRWVWITPDESR